jgi:two-component sensor histidine kinase
MRVLIVDDNPADRAIARREILRDHPGAEVVEIDRPETLDAALAAGEPDLAVLDFSLGWGDGVAALERVRRAAPDVPAILFSGSLGEERAVEMMRAGFDDFVLKEVGRLPRLRASARALLGRREERRARRRAEARYADLFRSVTVGVFACGPDGALEEANPALLSMLGIEDPAALGGTDLRRLLGAESPGGAESLAGALAGLRERGAARAEVSLPRPGGGTLRALVEVRAVGAGAGYEGVVTDVTALRASIEQREALLQEVFHRVYNNLQQVESLLDMQGRRFADPEVRRAFREVGDRTRALALVQRRLHLGGDYRTVDFAAFLRDLVDALESRAAGADLRVRADLAPLSIEIHRAIPLGLVAHELLANSLDHAFPGGRPGRVDLRLARGPDGAVLLEVSDDGVGPGGAVPPGSDPAAAGGGLGSRLVPSLARQLGASVTVEAGRGLSTVVRVPG